MPISDRLSWMRFLPCAVLFCCAIPLSASVSVQDTMIPHVRALVERARAEHNYPGVAVAVWQDGVMIWSEGFGYAHLEDSVPVDPARSLFRIGSVSKTLTAAGLSILVEQGALELDEMVQKYAPAFPQKRWPITIRQVAQHTAGIRHYNGFEFWSNVHYASVSDALEIFMHDTLLFEPGTKYSYSSYGWNLVSAAMEGASQVSFLSFMHNEVFSQLGMQHTYADDVHNTGLQRVGFYDHTAGKNTLSVQVDNSLKWAGGGFLSTAEDLLHFGAGILSHKLCSENTTRQFWQKGVLSDGKSTNYGIGWATNEDKRGRRWVGHSGGSVGGASMFLVYPGEALIVVTLINRSQARAQELAFTIADQFLH